MKTLGVILACALMASLMTGCAQARSLLGDKEYTKDFSYISTESWPGTCKKGKLQSPVFIHTTALPLLTADALKANLKDFGMIDDMKIFHTGTTFEINWGKWLKRPKLTIPAVNGDPMAVYQPGAFTTDQFEELKVEPLQFHFHVPGENALDGQWAVGEVHIVSRVEKGQSKYCDSKESGCLVVYAILLEHDLGITTDNEVLEKCLSVLPLNRTGEKHATKFDFKFNLNDMIPEDKTYITFPGSLTTPPCTEGVVWILMKTPIQASVSEIAMLEEQIALTPGPDCFQPRNTPQDERMTDFELDKMLESTTECPIPRQSRNNRHPQPLNGRIVKLVES